MSHSSTASIRSTLLPVLWVLVLLCCATLLAPTYARAQDQRALRTEGAEQMDAVLLLDSSGSMLQTDPNRLRDEGAKLFLQFLRAGDRIAVVSFDRSSSVVRPFTEFSPEALKAISEDISKIGARGEYTDLLAGVQGAVDLLDKEKRADAVPMVVLLSDGKMEPDPALGAAPYGRSEELLNKVLPGVKEKGIRIHTLSFSELADGKLLADISSATDGVSNFSPSSDKLHEAFAQLFLSIKKPQVVPLTGKGFSIDGDVQEATFYINREDAAGIVIVSPRGAELRADNSEGKIRWFHGQKFDVITVMEPETGNWQVRGLTSPDSFATVLTNLKLVSDWPSVVASEEKVLLQARMNEGEKPVVLKEMSAATKYEYQIIPADKISEPILEGTLVDDGSEGDKIAGDGIFSHVIQIEEAGEYRLWIVATAPTFQRRQQIPFKVRPPLIRIKVGPPPAQDPKEKPVAVQPHAPSDPHDTHGAEGHDEAHAAKAEGEEPKASEDVIEIDLSPEVDTFQSIEVKLVAVDANRRRFVIPLKRHDKLTYIAEVNLLPKEGEYDLIATLTGESKKRGLIKESTKPLHYLKEAGETPVHVVVVEEQKEVDEGPPVWPFALLVLLGNGAFGAVTVLKMKRNQSVGNLEMPTFAPADEVEAVINELEVRSAQTEIDLKDPILKNEVVLPSVTPSPRPVAAPPPEEPPPAESSPEESSEAT